MANTRSRSRGPTALAIALSSALAQAQPPTTRAAETAFEIHVETGALALEAHWDAIADSTYRIHESKKNRAIFEPGPAEAKKTYDARAFDALLAGKPVRVGEVWRMRPPSYTRFLAQFHGGVRARARHSGCVSGGRACLRAISVDHAEIVFRAHVEFELRKGAAYMTPAQYAGRMIVDRRRGQVVWFELRLPPRNSNADINVGGRGGMLADIVYYPRMELLGGTPPRVEWTREIPLPVAVDLLARNFYPSARIAWLPFDKLAAEAKRLGKPMHLMVLFGSLDDESC